MSSRLPVIGIPAALSRPNERGYVYQQVGAPYERALEEAGAAPLLLPVVTNRALVGQILELVDGILLQGGADVAPYLYGQETHPSVTDMNEATDRFEMEVCRLCLERNIPVLAVCRGIQVLNVAMGGTLIQDIPSQRSPGVAHRQPLARDVPTHTIVVEPGTRLAAMLGETHLQVNSFHHQAIDRAAPGLRVSARVEDPGGEDLIEAVEAPGEAFVVGVQFHPEETTRSVPATALLFRGLVEAAQKNVKR